VAARVCSRGRSERAEQDVPDNVLHYGLFEAGSVKELAEGLASHALAEEAPAALPWPCTEAGPRPVGAGLRRMAMRLYGRLWRVCAPRVRGARQRSQGVLRVVAVRARGIKGYSPKPEGDIQL
jgi:hypothetical protein